MGSAKQGACKGVCWHFPDPMLRGCEGDNELGAMVNETGSKGAGGKAGRIANEARNPFERDAGGWSPGITVLMELSGTPMPLGGEDAQRGNGARLTGESSPTTRTLSERGRHSPPRVCAKARIGLISDRVRGADKRTAAPPARCCSIQRKLMEKGSSAQTCEKRPSPLTQRQLRPPGKWGSPSPPRARTKPRICDQEDGSDQRFRRPSVTTHDHKADGLLDIVNQLGSPSGTGC